MPQRTDIHRESQLIPADYEHVLSYNLASTMDGWPVPSFRVNCELDGRHTDPETGEVVNGEHSPDLNCCIVGLRKKGVKWAGHGNTGVCTACGAHFIYGDVWRHTPTGEYIHTGHICADNMELLADRSAYELARDRARRSAISALVKERNAEERKAFLANHPGLEEALDFDHHIIADIKSRFIKWRTLSGPQIKLVFKIVKEAEERANQPEEVKIPVPIANGRQTVEGEILSLKYVEGYYGTQCKMLVKVDTGNGVWLTYGTAPVYFEEKASRGDVVRFDAKLKQGSDEYFAYYSRPTKPKIIKEKGE